MNKYIATVVLQNGETERVTYTRESMAEAYSAVHRFYDGKYQSLTMEELIRPSMADMRTIAVYDRHRKHHGVMDSIRFTASDLGLRPIDVARELGLTRTFLQHRG
jgi:hypothetical protein